jgi:glycosyltransferase involved in cell wall biosynthesis
VVAHIDDTGHLVAPGSPDRLADGIRQLLHEPSDARQVRRVRARNRIVTLFGRARMVAGFSALYEELVAVSS